ncbi:MAG: retention module-containing protein, partial [Bacillota bacterium]
MATSGNVIGKVAFIQGQAFVRAPDGTQRLLQVGDPVHEGDVLVTGPGGRVELSFGADQTYLLGQNETITLDAAVFGDAAPQAADAALMPGRGELAEITKAITDGGSLDALLDETAAGLSGGGGGDSSHMFVQLLRIAEAITPLSYAFDSGAAARVHETLPGGVIDSVATARAAQPAAGETSPSTDGNGTSPATPQPFQPTSPAAPSDAVTISASAPSVTEGGSIVYTATVANAVTGTPLEIALSNGQTIIIPVGQTSASSEPYAVRGDDAYQQRDETVSVSITRTSGGSYNALDISSTASTSVVNDADATTVSLSA